MVVLCVPLAAYMVSDEMQAGMENATSNLALSDIISNAMGHENSSKLDKNDLNVSTRLH